MDHSSESSGPGDVVYIPPPSELLKANNSTLRTIFFPTGHCHTIDYSKRVAILGFASTSRNLCPFDDQTLELWGLNSLYPFLPRYNRWFELHPKEHVQKNLPRAELQQRGLNHWEWLAKQPGPDSPDFHPIYMQEHFEEIPASVKWPREEINQWTRKMFGPQAEIDYFTSTPGEMVATAIYEGYGEIHLYGVDLLQSEEYAYQRPGCEYWLGIARGMGIKVVVPRQSALLKADYVYGFTEPTVTFGSMTKYVDFLHGKDGDMELGGQRLAAEVNATFGARQAFAEILKMIEEDGTGNVNKDFLRKKVEDLGARFEEGKMNLERMVAQREMLKSCAHWAEHFGRGGKLEGM